MQPTGRPMRRPAPAADRLRQCCCAGAAATRTTCRRYHAAPPTPRPPPPHPPTPAMPTCTTRRTCLRTTSAPAPTTMHACRSVAGTPGQCSTSSAGCCVISRARPRRHAHSAAPGAPGAAPWGTWGTWGTWGSLVVIHCHPAKPRCRHLRIQHNTKPRCFPPPLLQNRAAFSGKVVLDVGTGSGILAIFAAKAGGWDGKGGAGVWLYVVALARVGQRAGGSCGRRRRLTGGGTCASRLAAPCSCSTCLP